MQPPESGATELAARIDHTLLRPESSRMEIERLCREAVEFGFATVCVNPVWVAACARLLPSLPAGGIPRDRRPGICSVVGFPLGATTSDVKAYEARRAIADGATEIDMVINLGALKSGDLALVERDIAAVTTVCREAGVLSKAIIETALLSEAEKATACTIAKTAGADYVKTSTGFGPAGATVADVMLMRRIVGPGTGVKAAGGIRDLETARAMLAAGASRIGTSAGVAILQQRRGGARTGDGSTY